MNINLPAPSYLIFFYKCDLKFQLSIENIGIFSYKPYLWSINNSIIIELLLLAERSMSYDQDPSFNLMTPTADSNMSLYDEVRNWIEYYLGVLK